MEYNHKKALFITKFFTFVSLYVLFVLAFIISPYWTVLPSLSLKIIYLTVFLITGMVWAYFSSSSIKVSVNFNYIFNFVLVFTLVAILNFRTLASVIPWRGDEDFHILKTNYVVTTTPNSWFFYGSILICLILLLAWKRSFWVFPVGALSLTIILFLLNSKNPYQNNAELFLRYPFINYWFYAFTPKLASLFGSFYHEFLFRLPVFITVIITITLTLSKLKTSFSLLSSMLWALAFATMPILFYYTSILYLELPVILLMFTIVSDIRPMLQSNYDTLKRLPSWYSLLIIGFIKESVAPFLICFLVARWIIVSISRKNKSNAAKTGGAETFLQELLISVCVLLPEFLYLYLRTFVATKIRPYTPFIHNLFDLQVYSIQAKALAEQFGIILIIFLAGIIFAFYQKKFVNAVFWFFSILTYFVFFAVDHKVYIGYSRFNLFFLPPILAGSIYFLKSVIKHRYKLSIVAACIILIGNLLISPINMDGTKKWGNLSEKYYPYEDALQWIKENHHYEKILLTGLSYPYASLSFYFEKLEWQPRMKVKLTPDEKNISILESLAEASENYFDVVMIPVIHSQDLIPQRTDYYRLEMVSTNQAHTLLIYSRISKNDLEPLEVKTQEIDKILIAVDSLPLQAESYMFVQQSNQ